MQDIRAQVGEIRKFISHLVRQQVILSDVFRNRTLRHQMWSSLDLIEDAELAQEAYLTEEFGPSVGISYLVAFGALQALYAQQDAVENLCKSVEVSVDRKKYPGLKRIREIRNRSVGHRTETKHRNSVTAYHSMSRPDPNVGEFMLISDYSDGRHVCENVTIESLVTNQRKDVSQILYSVLDELEKREMEHKTRFRNKELATCFPDQLNYDLQKVCGSTDKPDDAWPGKMSLQNIENAVSDFKKELKRRGFDLETYGPANVELGPIEYAICELNDFFDKIKKRQKPKFSKHGAYIFAFFVEKRIPELKTLAQGLDEYYAT